jgi:beta-exotoxin I transport system permease protein
MPIEVTLQALLERRRSLLWWTIGLIATMALTIAFYPSIGEDQSLRDFSKDLPESLRALFVGGELDIASPAGYLNSQVFALTAPMLLLIFAIGAGSGAVAGEEERGTLDLLLAHPLRRRDYVVGRFAALAALVAALCVVVLGSVALCSRLVDLEIGFGSLCAASVSVGLLALLFGTVALATGAVLPGRASAIAVASGLVVASWLLDGLAQVVGVLEPLRPLSPYYQTIGRNPLRDGVPWTGWIVVTAAILLLLAVGAAGLQRRDVRQ